MPVPKRGTPKIGPGGIPWGILKTNSRYNKRPTKIKLNNMSHILTCRGLATTNKTGLTSLTWTVGWKQIGKTFTYLSLHKNFSDLWIIQEKYTDYKAYEIYMRIQKGFSPTTLAGMNYVWDRTFKTGLTFTLAQMKTVKRDAIRMVAWFKKSTLR